VRRHGQFGACEDAVQEALLAAALQWPAVGIPGKPRSWLVTVADRSLVDYWRAESARRRREAAAAALDPARRAPAGGPGTTSHPAAGRQDDTLVLLFLCCHPALSPPSQLALTLRAVGGLTTAEIAAAFLVPEATIGQRIRRAKQRIRSAGARFELPTEPERTERLSVVLHVLYLIFNEGYTTSSGPALHRDGLTAEAIRLARLLRRLLPDEGEVAGLLALMLLHESRRVARTSPAGELVLLEEQDRSLWNREQIAEGKALVERALALRRLGPYTLQAAIAAVHAEAPDAAATDWAQIVRLYDVLAHLEPSPVVELNRAVAVAMRDGPAAGLALIEGLLARGDLADYHLAHSARAGLLRRLGRTGEAAAAYRQALALTRQDPERRFLEDRLRELSPDVDLAPARSTTGREA
jgi:RNA polymerase sigma factor (sigma-70 family)